MTRPHLFSSLLVGLAAFLLDRGQKFLQVDILGWQGGEHVTVTPFFDYVLVWNTGISYGLLGDLPVWALGLIAAISIVALGIWWLRTSEALVRYGLMLIIGGALSNALDRLFYGGVADFFLFHWQGWSFYIFNIADAAITLGVVLLILDVLGVGRRRPA